MEAAMTRTGRNRPMVPSGILLPDLSRRGFLRGAAVGGLGLGLPGLLAACGTEGASVEEGACTSTDISESSKKLFFSNWPEYIDVKGKRMPSLEAFEKETGIDVTY